MSDFPAEEYGPCMLALDERQRRFVLHWLANGGREAAEAARKAGYSDVKDGAKVRAHRLLHNPKVVAALREEADKHLGVLPVIAAMNLKRGLLSTKQKDREWATDSVLDRTGYGRKTTQDIRVEHVDNRSTEDLMRLVQQFGAGALPAPIEGEFEEVRGGELGAQSD